MNIQIIIKIVYNINLTVVSAATYSPASSGLSFVRSKFARSLLVPPSSHTLGFLPAFSGFGLFLNK